MTDNQKESIESEDGLTLPLLLSVVGARVEAADGGFPTAAVVFLPSPTFMSALPATVGEALLIDDSPSCPSVGTDGGLAEGGVSCDDEDGG